MIGDIFDIWGDDAITLPFFDPAPITEDLSLDPWFFEEPGILDTFLDEVLDIVWNVFPDQELIPYHVDWNPDAFDGFGTPVEDANYWSMQTVTTSCAVVSQINIYESLTGETLSEEEVCELAEDMGWYDPEIGTRPENIAKILEDKGINVEQHYEGSLEEIVDALKRGDKVLVGLDANEIWYPYRLKESGMPVEQTDAGHAVWVTGLDFAPDGSVKVILNDSGIQTGRMEAIDAADFMNAWEDYDNLIVLAEPDGSLSSQASDSSVQGYGAVSVGAMAGFACSLTKEEIFKTLKKFSVSGSEEDREIEGLVRGIHRMAELRDSVTLETVPLPPIPLRKHGQWRLMLPLASHQKGGRLRAPWGIVEWSWPEKELEGRKDLREDPETQRVREQVGIFDLPLNPAERAKQEGMLFRRLKEIMDSESEEVDLGGLGPLYSELVPKSVYQLYWHLAPESKEWLVKTEKKHEPIEDLEHLIGPEKSHRPVTVWLDRALSLAQELGDKPTINEVRGLHERLSHPAFRIAFVGEFNRGKSTLVNRLLGRNLLPVEVLSTASGLVSILPGDVETAAVRVGKRWARENLLDQFSWEKIEKGGKFQAVRLGIRNDWLKESDIEIIDTPGVNDLKEKKAQLAFNYLSCCDGAVLVVRADKPLSMTEKTFLKHEILTRRVPNILVAVSMLDLIAERDRERLIGNIRKRISDVDQNIAVVPIYPAEDAGDDNSIHTLRREITAMTQRGAWRDKRSYWIGLSLMSILERIEHMIERLDEDLESSHGNELVQKATREEKKMEQQWEHLRLEFNRKGDLTASLIRKKIEALAPQLAGELENSMGFSPDPIRWWKLLPDIAEKQLKALSAQQESAMRYYFESDYGWFCSKVEQQFKVRLTKRGRPSITPEVPPLPDLAPPVKSSVNHKIVSRYLTSGVYWASYALLGPFAVAFSGLIPLLPEIYLKRVRESQGERLKGEIKAFVIKVLQLYADQVVTNVKRTYETFSGQLERDRKAWLRVQHQDLSRQGSISSKINLAKILQGCEKLHQEIELFIQREI